MMGRLKAIATVGHVKQASRELLPWAGLLGMAYLVVSGELTDKAREALVLWGPGILLIFMAWQYLPSFIESQKQQAVALSDLAASVREQGVGYQRELQEIAHGQQVILERIDHIKERISGAQ